jgi:hypothetical protein
MLFIKIDNGCCRHPSDDGFNLISRYPALARYNLQIIGVPV